MPHEPGHPPENQVPEGAIGATIADEQPSRAKQFFTDPKNLATMLVLASALAQPRTQGRSVLAHGLRGGVGALAFRGGLDQQIHEQAQKDAEQRSIAEARVAQQRTAAEQVAATRERTESLEDISEAEIASREAISQAEIEAGKFTHAPPAGGTVQERALLQAQKNYSDALLEWAATGRQGSPPEYGPYLLRALQAAALAGGDVSGIDFEPAPVPTPDTEDEATVDTATDGRRVPEPPRDLSGELVSARVLTNKDRFNTKVPLARVNAAVASKIRRDLPDAFGDADDATILDRVSQLNQDISGRLATMTEAEAQAILKDPTTVRLLNKENLKAVRRLSRQTAAQKQLESIGRSGAL